MLYSQFSSLLSAAEHDPAIKKLVADELTALDKTLIKDFIHWKHNGKLLEIIGIGRKIMRNGDWIILTVLAPSNQTCSRTAPVKHSISSPTSLPMDRNFMERTITRSPLKKHHQLKDSVIDTIQQAPLLPSEYLNRFSLGTKNKSLKKNSDGTLTLYAGNKNPGADKESNFGYPDLSMISRCTIRAYWGDTGITDGSWTPPVVEKY